MKKEPERGSGGSGGSDSRRCATGTARLVPTHLGPSPSVLVESVHGPSSDRSRTPRLRTSTAGSSTENEATQLGVSRTSVRQRFETPDMAVVSRAEGYSMCLDRFGDGSRLRCGWPLDSRLGLHQRHQLHQVSSTRRSEASHAFRPASPLGPVAKCTGQCVHDQPSMPWGEAPQPSLTRLMR